MEFYQTTTKSPGSAWNKGTYLSRLITFPGPYVSGQQLPYGVGLKQSTLSRTFHDYVFELVSAPESFAVVFHINVHER